MNWAPIAVFVFNRPEHTRKTIETLIACEGFEKSPIYIFSDGPRKQEDLPDIENVRATVRTMLGDNAVYFEARVNKGLARSIIDGVTMVLKEHGRIIVIEDDLSVSPHILAYFNEGLKRYENDANVMQISGHMFPVPELEMEKEALFLPFTTSWGWATWQRAWTCFDTSAKGWERLDRDTHMRSRFDLEGAASYSAMLKAQMTGQIDSWAIRWYWSVFKAEGIVLFPPSSYVKNCGFDGSGTHGWRSANSIFFKARHSQDADICMPREIRVSAKKFDAVKRVIKKMNSGRMKRIRQMVDSIRQKMFRRHKEKK